MSADTVRFEIQGSVGKITLDRPALFNSFNRAMSLAMQEALNACAENKNVRAIYITGEGKAFCAGQDLQEATDPQGPEIEKIVTEHYNPIIRGMRSMEKPIVCAVNGVAAGAGANVALAADIVVARKSAVFVQAFSSIGLIPDSGGTYVLPRLVGLQKATAYTMLADKIDAVEAERVGMIYKWFEDDQFEEASWKIAEKLSLLPTVGLGLTKRLFNQSHTNNLDQQLAAEAKVQVSAAASWDFKEGVQAFLEKRKPQFKGE